MSKLGGCASMIGSDENGYPIWCGKEEVQRFGASPICREHLQQITEARWRNEVHDATTLHRKDYDCGVTMSASVKGIVKCGRYALAIRDGIPICTKHLEQLKLTSEVTDTSMEETSTRKVTPMTIPGLPPESGRCHVCKDEGRITPAVETIIADGEGEHHTVTNYCKAHLPSVQKITTQARMIDVMLDTCAKCAEAALQYSNPASVSVAYIKAIELWIESIRVQTRVMAQIMKED